MGSPLTESAVILCMCFIAEHGSLLYFSRLFCFLLINCFLKYFTFIFYASDLFYEILPEVAKATGQICGNVEFRTDSKEKKEE